MDAPEKDPGIPEDLKVQCHAPPEPQILTAHEQDDLEGQERIAAPVKAPASEIAPEPDEPHEIAPEPDEPHEIAPEPDEPHEIALKPDETREIAPEPREITPGPREIAPEPREIAPGTPEIASEPIDVMRRSWKVAIKSENVLQLLEILEKSERDEFVTLELQYRRRDRTALHVAAKRSHKNNLTLAKAIFDKLLTDWESGLMFATVSDQRRLKRNVEYIIAVEKGSGKTAMELALEKNPRFVECIKGIQKKMFPSIELWEAAIRSANVDALLEILEKGPSDLLGLELAWAGIGRTALHIAAKTDHPKSSKLAKAILDQLLESRQECRSILVSGRVVVLKDILHTVDEYIKAKDSEKTARELAEESSNRRSIAEYIDAFPSSEVQKLWESAIECRNVDELLKIYGQRERYYLLDLEREGLRRGRTALHIAAKSDHSESSKLAIAILGHLLMSQEERYTDAIFGKYMRVTVGDYITAVESADSQKTAMELAEESNKQDIVESIKGIQKRSAEHAKIDEDVAGFEQLLHQYVEGLFNSTDSAKREKGKTWLLKAIAARDCSLLMKVVEILQSQPRENFEDDEFWKCEGESGRTMLHVAAMQGCFRLAKPLLDRARERKDRKYVVARDRSSGLDAFEMADDIIGNKSIAEYVTMTLNLMENKNYVHPTCFFKAYQGSEWHQGLASGSSSLITRLLKVNKHLLLETYEGCTVLHVAILCEDESLVQTLLNMFGQEKKISFGGSCFPLELTWQEMLDKMVEIDKSLFDDTKPKVFSLAKNPRPPLTGSFNGSTMALIQHMEKERGANDEDKAIQAMEIERGANDKDKAIQEMEIERGASDKDKAIPEMEIERGANDKDKTIREMLVLYDKEPSKFTKPYEESFALRRKIVEKWKGEWDKGYTADVDFNFEVEPRFTCLKFHYACKYPLKFREFLESIFTDSDLFMEGRNLLDAQGRSVYHIMQDYCNNQDHYPSEKNLREKDPNQLKELWFGLVWFGKPDWIAFIAASSGDQVMLRFLMENEIDLTITDAKKRTLLHHAANPTILDLDDLLKCPMIGHCFPTVKDVCDVRRKWDMERKKTSMKFPSKISDKDFDLRKHVTSLNMERKACILLLLQEGVDLSQEDGNKKLPMIGRFDDTDYQSWWYDMVAKDFIDKRNNYNQAASALSVVGTLVAATSYIGPLQPPMSFTDEGFLHGNVLIKVFMMSNTLAFILAMTSVIFAVVPSLPMPQESARLELKRAKSTVIHSLYMLLLSIFSIILSFGAASMVVMRDQDFFLDLFGYLSPYS